MAKPLPQGAYIAVFLLVLFFLQVKGVGAEAVAERGGEGAKSFTTTNLPPGISSSSIAVGTIPPSVSPSAESYVVIDLTLGGTNKEQRECVTSLITYIFGFLGVNCTVTWNAAARRQLLTPLTAVDTPREAEGEGKGSHCSTDSEAPINSTTIALRGFKDQFVVQLMLDQLISGLLSLNTTRGEPTKDYICSSAVTMRSSAPVTPLDVNTKEASPTQTFLKNYLAFVLVVAVAAVATGLLLHRRRQKAAQAKVMSTSG